MSKYGATAWGRDVGVVHNDVEFVPGLALDSIFHSLLVPDMRSRDLSNVELVEVPSGRGREDTSGSSVDITSM